MGPIELLVSDFILSFLWVCSGALVKIIVFSILGFRHNATGQFAIVGFSLLGLFFFARLMKLAKGGAYNPLTILAVAISGGFDKFLFTIGARIPAQVLGAIYGVRLLIYASPEISQGPKLNVDIHHGALVEGLLTFVMVFISLSLTRIIPENFVMKTWISSISKLILSSVGSDSTGGCMNPASAIGWAHARGDHITREHILVYWLGPIEGTLLAAWIVGLLFQKPKQKLVTRSKSE